MNKTLSYFEEKARDRALNIFTPENANTSAVAWVQSMVASMEHSFNQNLLNGIKQTDIDNKTGLDLENEGEKYNVIRQQASQSIGNLVINVTSLSATISAGTEFVYNGLTYLATNNYIANDLTFGDSSQNFTITEIDTFVSTNLARVYCENHGLAVGTVITGNGFTVDDQANPITFLNGSQTISYVEDDLFEFVNTNIVTDTTTTSFNSTQYFDAKVIIPQIQSVNTGSVTNITKGQEVFFKTTPDTNIINASGFVDYNEIGGGADLEGDTDYRARIKARKVDFGTNASIKTLVLNVSGVTDVEIIELIYGYGTYGVLFLRRKDTNPIPTAQEIQAVFNVLTSEDNRDPNDVNNIYVEAPSEVKRKITITGLLPNTDAMKDAVKSKIVQIINDFGIQNGHKTNLTASDLEKNLIQNVYDSATNRIQDITNLEVFDINDNASDFTLLVKEFLSISTDNITFV